MFLDSTVAVVVPAHNEQSLIADTVRRMPAFVDLVFVVDDASEDATAARVAEAARERAGVTLVRHPTNRGVGASIVTGYRAALGAGARVVAVMDGDGQMDAGDLARVVEPVASGRADMAKGHRFEGLRPRGPMPATRLVGNHALSWATRLAAWDFRPLDAQCGFTALSSDALARLPLDLLYPRYGFPNDLVLRAYELRLRVEAVPVRALYGLEVSGIRPFVAIPRIFGLLGRAAVRRAALAPAKRWSAREATPDAAETS